MKNNDYMRDAIKLAKDAVEHGEVPVGAVIVNKDKEVISTAFNLVESFQNACMHAEIIAIEKACESLENKYLSDCDIYVNLEPCPMCAGAIAHAKIRRVYFGAYDPKGGGVDNGAKVFSYTPHKPEVYGGIMEQECAEILKDFFKKKR